MEKNQPIKKLKIGGISVSIWQNETVSKDDKPVTFYSATLQRSYKDKHDTWQNPSVSLNQRDLPQAILLLEEAQRYIALAPKDTGSQESDKEVQWT